MPLEVAPTIDRLVIGNPTSGDPPQQGDDHLRLIKGAIKGSFPKISANADFGDNVFNLVQADVEAGAVPVGGIILWSGALITIPENYALCDGQTVGTTITPDLTDKFIIQVGANALGANSADKDKTSTAVSVGFSGAFTDDHILLESQMPSHTHPSAADTTGTQEGDLGLQPVFPAAAGNATGPAGGDGGHKHGLDATSTDAHEHVTDVTPPFYTLAYIMRIT